MNRTELIESYGNAYNLLMDAIKEFPLEMWQWKPSPEKWSIHEVIVHIADSEVNSYVRCRRLLAEPGSGVYGYNENKWAANLNYHTQSTEDALELFRILRKGSYLLSKSFDAEKLDTATVMHSENGVMTFDEWLVIYMKNIFWFISGRCSGIWLHGRQHSPPKFC